MNLGDFFDEEDRRKFAERNINLGSSILIKVPDIDVTYNKYIVIAAENTSEQLFAYVVINSVINENVFPTESTKLMHVKLEQTKHPFLTHDSFVDCSQLRSFTRQELIDYIKNNQDKLVGNVDNDVFKTIQYKITTAVTISPAQKRLFGFVS